MKKSFLFFLCMISFATLVSAINCDDSCSNGANTSCLEFGVIEGTKYCDYLTNTLVLQKTSGDCVNDFECAVNYTCLYNACTNSFNPFIEYLQVANISFCSGDDKFWYNSSQASPINATLVNTDLITGISCYKCNLPLVWNGNLSKCVPSTCTETPGCLNKTSLNNSVNRTDRFCSVGSCFSCNSNFDWNATSQECEPKPCIVKPGCLNVTNLTNGRALSRFCDVGSCFSCNSNYYWNNVSCVLSNVGGTTYGTTIVLSSTELASGEMKSLKPYDKLRFASDGISYELIVRSFSTSSSTMNYEIDPVYNNLVARTGSDNKMDLNSDGTLDINVVLVAINNNQAQVKITEISVGTPVFVTPNKPVTPTENKPSNRTTGTTTRTEKSGNYTVVLILLVVLAFALIAGAIALKKKISNKNGSSASTNNGYSTNYQ